MAGGGGGGATAVPTSPQPPPSDPPGDHGAWALTGPPESCNTTKGGVTTCEPKAAECDATSWRPATEQGLPKCGES